jgi:hypothetical protein
VKEKKLMVLGTMVGIFLVKVLLFTDAPGSLTELVFLCFPFLVGHTLWIQSSRGYNLEPETKTNIFFGWGHHLPVHDPVYLLEKQWAKDYTIYEPDGNVIHGELGPDTGFGSIPYECLKEGTYRLASYVPTGFYSIYRGKDGKWHHYTESIDNIKNPEETIDKMLISLKFWEWTKAIMTVGKPSDAAMEPVGHEMEIMLDRNPIEYKMGDTVHFTVLKNGKALTEPGGSFYAQDQGRSSGFDDYLYNEVPLNEDGTGSFELTKQGIWHLKIHWGYPAPKEFEDKCWIFAYMVSITFQVDPDWGVKYPSYQL